MNFDKEGKEEDSLLSLTFLQQGQPNMTFPELFNLLEESSITTTSSTAMATTTMPTTTDHDNTTSNSNLHNEQGYNSSSLNKRSCDICRKRKVKCDSNIQHPCTECKKNQVHCEFLTLPRKRGRKSKEYIEVLESRVVFLERLLEKSLVRRTTKGRRCASMNNSDENTNKNGRYLQQQQQQQLQATISYTNPSVVSKQISSLPESYILQPSLEFIQQTLPTASARTGYCPGAEKTIKSYFDGPHSKWVFIDKHAFLMQFYYQYPQPLEEHLFYAICAVGFQFIPCKNRTQEQLVAAKYLREKAMYHVKNLLFEQSSITSIQTLILMSTLAPTSSSGTTTSITILNNDNNMKDGDDYEGNEEENDDVYHTGEQVLLRSSTSLLSTNW
ncbi:hypothetical protein INT45_011813 [Circinella minor]|uniref:Zn(2)-C6 fungal-type domain-containing protein n=1 Tax=Circinella minor TaxID=1195481 RepID=A0A8H7S942_9FUNG|nr:hypothetical protein INT45_011813 [Circinella minor]